MARPTVPVKIRAPRSFPDKTIEALKATEEDV